jgi:hypothetical protein
MNSANKENAKKLVDNQKITGGTYFVHAIHELVTGIKSVKKDKDSGRVQSVIFLTDGVDLENRYGKELLLKELGQEWSNYDFTVNTFGFGSESKANTLVEFSDSRDGGYYAINNLVKIQDYVLNVIGAMRTTSYRNVRFVVKSKYNIEKVYGQTHLSNCTISQDKKTMNNTIFQFITGKDYNYVLLLNIPNNISIGDKILTVDAQFYDFHGYSYKTSNYLLFYQAIGCFNCYKEEYCRVWAMEAIEKIISSHNAQTLQKDINQIKDYCDDYDGYSELPMTRFYADTIGKGIPIIWEDML